MSVSLSRCLGVPSVGCKRSVEARKLRCISSAGYFNLLVWSFKCVAEFMSPITMAMHFLFVLDM